ncbi:MAG: LacI family DNA-binding transcriptional regulator [Actinomyces urogenitalis]|uniref:LacI family DNA-binding transcriptional regulator n=1 Tax=Actinomyces urogenitalis TaxID=103621 RepID=UPI00242AA3D7|nr:LacI family DNA-binding transcriptional regulator [Actinomyces urogenitalis]MCI7456142.1 LacI family DNA-binding transcriptional regulator [Actinomyces urogenitalis]MDY3679244.1 LacI family DNA-binding transcriptional regulator [Actinomyces urogenitalis]
MPRPRSDTPTQAAVASAAKVSVPTVSKALRGDPTISARTRERVLATARRLGYPVRPRRQPEPLSAADSIDASGPGAVRKQPHVAVLFETVDNAYTPEVLKGMLTAAAELDVIVHIDEIGAPTHASGPRSPERTMELATRAIESADGLILATTPCSVELFQYCSARGVPVVSIDPACAPPEGLVALSASNWRGGVQATRHLLGLGHRRIGVVGGPSTSVPSVERLAGYRSALAEAGIAFDPELVVNGRYTYEAGVAGAAQVLEVTNPPTAVFALSDSIAFGVMAYAHEQGISIPEHLSVIGFDNTAPARLVSPGLTVIHQPLRDMGRESLELIKRAIDGGYVPGRPVELQTTLVQRGSTAPPGSR